MDSELVDAEHECPICKSNDSREIIFSLQRHPDVYLVSCKKCKGLSASKMPTPKTLGTYYGSYYQPENKKITFHNVSRLATHIFRSIDVSYFSNLDIIRILDYGGGDGSLAIGIASLIKRSTKKKIEITLIDFNASQSLYSEQIDMRIARSIKETSQEFHIIIASAILEHIPQLHSILFELVNRLAVGGFFYARTPYIAPFKKLIPSMDFTFPAHVHDLGPQFWSQFTNTFSIHWQPVFLRSSTVETEFSQAWLRTLMAYTLKFPSRLEELVFGKIIRKSIWKFVGGWEVLYVNKDN